MPLGFLKIANLMGMGLSGHHVAPDHSQGERNQETGRHDAKNGPLYELSFHTNSLGDYHEGGGRKRQGRDRHT